MNKARFVYWFRASNCAVAMTERDDLTQGVLLFTCPEDWLPADQKQFEAAAAFYGVQRPDLMKYDPNEIPF